MRPHTRPPLWRRCLHRVLVSGGSVTLTLAFFLVLPLLQAIAKPRSADMTTRSVDTAHLEPPPPPEPEPEEDEPEPEEEPPELADEVQPLNLSMLELVLNDGIGDGFMGGDFEVQLGTRVASPEETEALFSLSDLDQTPRATFQPQPVQNARTRKKAPGKVVIIFVVDEAGRVIDAKVQSSSDPVFDGPAMSAVKKWRFEPGKRHGKPVRFRMRQPITFPKASG